MGKVFAICFLLFCILSWTAVCFGSKRCPNKCLKSKLAVVRQCKKRPLQSKCAVKRCRNRRGWKCGPRAKKRTPTKKVACKPIGDPSLTIETLCGNIGCSPLASIPERVVQVECECEGGGGSFGIATIISDFKKPKDTRCFENCMKEVACLNGACTPEKDTGNTCVEKLEVLSENVANKDNQRDCCEDCDGKLEALDVAGEQYEVCRPKTE